jgi:hypothetical protein
MALPGALQRIVDWLRASYPEGVPEHDYLPLFALLSTRLSAEEARQTMKAVPPHEGPERVIGGGRLHRPESRRDIPGARSPAKRWLGL